jgi:hypothetical protein
VPLLASGEEGEGDEEMGGGEEVEQELELEEAEEAAAAEQPVQQRAGEDGPAEPSYIQVFILKYTCPRPRCYGTLAPCGVGSDVYECNFCGGRRTEAEFMLELEA